MNKELKPCPFCGGKAQLDHDGLTAYSYVKCKKCHARTTVIAIATYHCSDDKAIELWNHRADVLENVKGEWISTGFMEVKCSNCKETFHELESANFCPNCGAQMEK